MASRILAAFSMTLGLFASTIGVAGSAAAAPASWPMPLVRGMLLSEAVKTIQDITGPGLNLRLIDLRNGQDVHNHNMWEVCAQRPRVGKPIWQETKKVNLYVKRFSHRGCA